MKTRFKFAAGLTGMTALALLSCRVQAQSLDTVDWTNDTVADGTGTGTLANGAITVTYTTQPGGGFTLPIDFNNSLATQGAVGSGVTHQVAAAFAADNLTATTQTITFSSTVINPIVLMVFADPNTSLTFNAPLTLLSSNNAQVTGSTLVSFVGATNTQNDGFGARVNGTFGPSNPLTFIYSNQSGSGQSFSLTVSATPAAVPEPGSIALLAGLGVTGAGFLARRRRK